MTQQTASIPRSTERASRLIVAATVFLMGAGLVLVTGFAHPEALHDAAHDARHALAFPCH